MTRVDAIIQMKGKDENTDPIEINEELIYPWDIDLNLKEFSDEQIEEFYDAEEKDERA